MKKLTLTLALLAGMATSAFASLADGQTAPDRTVTDIYGNSYTFSAISAQNKVSFICFGQAGFASCYNYLQHNSAFDSLWTQYGPSGTNTVMVFFIEDDPYTDTTMLHGGFPSAGDYMTGTGYPIINCNMTDALWFNANYSPSQYPLIQAIGPNGTIRNIPLPAHLSDLIGAVTYFQTTNDVYPLGSPNAYCFASGTISPQVTIYNNGFAPITSMDITIRIDNGTPQTYPVTSNIPIGGSQVITLPAQTVTGGAHTITFTTSNPNNAADGNPANDMATFTFTTYGTPTLAPYAETFTSLGFPYANMILDNPSSGITYARVPTGNPVGSGSIQYRSIVNPVVGEVCRLVLPPLDMSAMSFPVLQFDVAGRQYPPDQFSPAGYSDSASIEVSVNCGATWTTVWTKGGSTLATVFPADTNEFTPSQSSDWRQENVSMAAYSGNPNVLIRITVWNGYANNLYFDNISVTAPLGTPSQPMPADGSVQVFPNPGSAMTAAFALSNEANVTISIYDVTGRFMSSTNYGMMSSGLHEATLNIAELPSGIYFINVVAGAALMTKAVSVIH